MSYKNQHDYFCFIFLLYLDINILNWENYCTVHSFAMKCKFRTFLQLSLSGNRSTYSFFTAWRVKREGKTGTKSKWFEAVPEKDEINRWFVFNERRIIFAYELFKWSTIKKKTEGWRAILTIELADVNSGAIDGSFLFLK